MELGTGRDVPTTLDGRRQPLTPGANSVSTAYTRTTSLNDRLNTEYVDLRGADESSLQAKITRTITGFVGKFITPRRLLVVLRVLKAITFCFLILTLAADLMYIAFLEVLASKNVKQLAGGNRDLVIRIYGLFLCGIAICIELDYSVVVKSFYGFKGFIPRAFLLFFISAITGSHSLHLAEQNNNNNNNAYGDDDQVDDQYDDANYQYADDDDAFAGVSSEIPGSAVVFQMVTSFILGICACTYFVFGILCFDRFTSRAFLSTNDPLVTTAIPQINGNSTGGGSMGSADGGGTAGDQEPSSSSLPVI